MVNDLVNNFCKHITDEPLKIIILDEADNVTKKAQQQLINFMENYKNIRIVFTCNDVNQIIEPIQSRCMMMKFSKPSVPLIRNVLHNILTHENVQFNDGVLTDIAVYSNSDIRKSINNAEAIYLASGLIDAQSVANYFMKPTTHSILVIIRLALIEKQPQKAIQEFMELHNSGVNNIDFTTTVISLFQNFDTSYCSDFSCVSQPVVLKILQMGHECYYRLTCTLESVNQIVRFLYDVASIDC
jgi:DNA polymerase III delta prime subunit